GGIYLYPKIAFPESICHIIGPNDIFALGNGNFIIKPANILPFRGGIGQMHGWPPASPIKIFLYIGKLPLRGRPPDKYGIDIGKMVGRSFQTLNFYKMVSRLVYFKSPHINGLK